MTRKISDDARCLALRVGVGDLVRPQPCHGYANACVCNECRERSAQAQSPKREPRQPWDIAA